MGRVGRPTAGRTRVRPRLLHAGTADVLAAVPFGEGGDVLSPGESKARALLCRPPRPSHGRDDLFPEGHGGEANLAGASPGQRTAEEDTVQPLPNLAAKTQSIGPRQTSLQEEAAPIDEDGKASGNPPAPDNQARTHHEGGRTPVAAAADRLFHLRRVSYGEGLSAEAFARMPSLRRGVSFLPLVQDQLHSPGVERPGNAVSTKGRRAAALHRPPLPHGREVRSPRRRRKTPLPTLCRPRRARLLPPAIPSTSVDGGSTNASPRGRTSRHKREGRPGRKSHLHNRSPTTLQRKQQRRGPSKPGGNERPQQAQTCPPDTESSASPVLTQANAAQAQEGSLNVEGEIPPAQEGEAAPHSSREEGGPLTPPGKEPPLPPGVERATRGGYARAQLKIVEVSGSPNPTRWENTPRFAMGDHCLCWSPLRPTACSSPQDTIHPPSWKRCWTPDSLRAESKGSPSCWVRTARPSTFSLPSRGAPRLGRGGRSSGRWAGARPTLRHGPPRGGTQVPAPGRNFASRCGRKRHRAERERLESLRQWRQECRDLQHAREVLGRRISREV